MRRMRGKATGERTAGAGTTEEVLQRAVPDQGMAASESAQARDQAIAVELMQLIMVKAAELNVAVALVACQVETGRATISGNTAPDVIRRMLTFAQEQLSKYNDEYALVSTKPDEFMN